MLLDKPGRDFIDPRMLQVMTALDRVNVPMSGRQMGRVLDTNHSTSTRILNTLAEIGVVTLTSAGSASQYRPNRKHFYWQLFDLLNGFTAHVHERLATLLPEELRQPTQEVNGHASVFIFGSVARGEANAASDLDVGVVVPTEAAWKAYRDNADALQEELETYTGNDISLFVITWKGLVAMVTNGDPLSKSWAADGQHVAGERIQDLINEILLGRV